MKRSLSSWVLKAIVGGLCCVASCTDSSAAQERLGRSYGDSNHDVCPLAALLEDVDDKVVEAASKDGSWVVLSHDWLSYGCPPEAAYAAKPQTAEKIEWHPTPDAVCMGVLAPTDNPANFKSDDGPRAGLASGILPIRPAGITELQPIAWWGVPKAELVATNSNFDLIRKYSDDKWLSQLIKEQSKRQLPIHHAGYRASDYQVYDYPPFFGDRRSDRANETRSDANLPFHHAAFRREAELHNSVPERNMIAEMYYYARASLREVSEKTVEIQAELISLTRMARVEMAKNSAAVAKAPKIRPARKRAKPLRKAALLAPWRSLETMIDHYIEQIQDVPMINNPERELLHFERNLEITLCGSTFQGDWRAIREAIEGAGNPPKKPKSKEKKRIHASVASSHGSFGGGILNSIQISIENVVSASTTAAERSVASATGSDEIK